MSKYFVEFIGTLSLLYVILALGNALAIGAALATIIIVTSKFSDGHFNPAVTIMMIVAGKMPMRELLPYVISQIAGGLLALELYKRYKF